MGRDDSRQSQERLLDHSFFCAANDQAEIGQDYSDQLHRWATRRILSHALWSLQGRHHQLCEGAGYGSRAAQYSGELRGARLGGHGHVQSGDQLHDRRSHQCKRRVGTVRLRCKQILRGILEAGALLVALSPSHLRAQNPDNMMPEERTAKGKQVLEQLITALGGSTYLDIRESNCEGRLAQFGHSGELTGYTPFKVYWRYPDKNRTDFSKKGVIVNVYNGDRGWTLD